MRGDGLRTTRAAKCVKCGKGYALHFDGLDDYVNCGSGPSLDIRGAISLEASVYPEAMPGCAVALGHVTLSRPKPSTLGPHDTALIDRRLFEEMALKSLHGMCIVAVKLEKFA